MVEGGMKAEELRAAAAQLLALAADVRIQGDVIYSEFLAVRASQLLEDAQSLTAEAVLAATQLEE
jgi:hypothetical protein